CFHRKTLELLGRPEYSSKEMKAYQAMAREILDDARTYLPDYPVAALVAARGTLLRKLEQWSSRSGTHAEKTALDALSYEARAAVNRCYSIFWRAVIQNWAK